MSRLGPRGRIASHLIAGVFAFSLASLYAGGLVNPSLVQAQDNPTRAAARTAFQGGVASYEAGAYAEALQHFQEAYRLMPNPTVRVNMANCYEQLDRPLEAIDHFERFLVEAGDDAPRAQVREVRSALSRLRSRVGEVFIRVQPDGATVIIDHGDSRRTPILDAIQMTAGGHHVEIRMDGHRTVNRDIVVDGGGRAEVEVTLEEGSDPVAASGGADDITAPDPNGNDTADGDGDDLGEGSSGGFLGLSTPVIISGSATIGLGLIALGTGIAALGANNDYNHAVARFRSTPAGPPPSPAHVQAQQDGNSAKNRANRLATATDIFLVATLAGAGVTAYFLFFSDDESDTTLAAMPVVSPDGSGVVLSGRF